MATPVQTLEVGKTVASSFGRLGGRVGPSLAPLPRIRGMMIGRVGGGKSALLQSHPRAFVINADCTSTTTLTPKAAIWPSPSSETGIPCGDDGASLCMLTWEKIEEKFKILREMALAGDPTRPETVFIDSITGIIPILREYLTRKGGKTSFKDLHGPTAYDDMYTMLVQAQTDIHAHGYGFFYIAHIMDYKMTVDDKGTEKEYPDINLTASFLSRLLDKQELVAMVEKRRTILREPDPRFPGSTNKFIERPVDQPVFTVQSEDPYLTRYLKARVPFNTVPLPRADAWAAVLAEYNRARASVAQGVPA